MKYIKKRVEPKDFGHWKAKAKTGENYGYSLLNDPTKGILHDSLMQEQGYICCYCCQRIASKTSHIEHLIPILENMTTNGLNYLKCIGYFICSQHLENWYKSSESRKQE